MFPRNFDLCHYVKSAKQAMVKEYHVQKKICLEMLVDGGAVFFLVELLIR